MLKKITAAACALAMLAGITTALPKGTFDLGASIETNAETYGDFDYTVRNDGTVWLTKYNGTAAKPAIPSVIGNRKVTGIGDRTFAYNTHIKTAVIPNGVTYIGFYAFYDCDALTEVKFGSSVKEIGLHAFSGCTDLTKAVLPNSVEIVYAYAFYKCDSLKKMTIPKSVGFIDNKAFGYSYDANGKDIKVKDCTLFCYSGTVGEKYAKDNGFKPVIFGDVNGDGNVDMLDLTALQRHINGWKNEVVESALDVNGDGNVDMLDLTTLQRLINGWKD